MKKLERIVKYFIATYLQLDVEKLRIYRKNLRMTWRRMSYKHKQFSLDVQKQSLSSIL